VEEVNSTSLGGQPPSSPSTNSYSGTTDQLPQGPPSRHQRTQWTLGHRSVIDNSSWSSTGATSSPIVRHQRHRQPHSDGQRHTRLFGQQTATPARPDHQWYLASRQRRHHWKLGASTNIIDNASLVFNRSNIVTNSGGISGTGSLHSEGSGTLVSPEHQQLQRHHLDHQRHLASRQWRHHWKPRRLHQHH